MGINANVSAGQQITASVGETKIDVAVSGGVGPTGAGGAAATITVGQVTTGAPGSSASVVNAGTTSAAVLNFTIPAGSTGQQGIQGERGEQGVQGIQGVPGAVGPAGPTGPAGTTTWAGITDKPSTFTPSSHQHVAADITDFTSAVIAAAPPTTNASLLTSGTLPDARLSANIARTSDVSAAVAAVVNAAPAALDTLNELAAALGNDASFATTVTNSLAGKANATHTHTVSAITDAGTAATRNVPASGNAGATEVVLGSDTRLANSRTPTSHAASHGAGGADQLFDQNLNTTNAVAFAGATVSRQTDQSGTQVVLSVVQQSNIANPYTVRAANSTTGAAGFQLGNASINPSNFWQFFISSDSEPVFKIGQDNIGDYLCIKTGGNVGIGTAAPASRLHVVGSFAVADGGDPSKKFALDVSGVSAGNTRTLSVPDASGTIVLGDDARLSNARTPTAHNQAWTTITSTPTTLAGYGITDAVGSSDARLSDARTPTAHKSSHATGGSDAIAPADIGAAAASHAHAWSDITSGVPSSFAPSAHKASHATGGTDALTPADIGAASALHTHTVTDVTGAVATTDSRLSDARTPLAHVHSGADITSGTVPIARLGTGSPSASNFLRGDGSFAAAPVTSVDGSTGAVAITKAVIYEFTRSSAPSGATGTTGSWTWSLPTGAKLVEFLIIAAGGGGGSGRRGAAGSARFGGGGGASGGVIHATVDAARVTTSLGVVVGAGGAGGAAATADDANGNAGSSGGVSNVSFSGGSSGMLQPLGGSGGSGGTNAAGSGGSPGGTGNNRTWLGTAGSNSSITGTPNRSFPSGNVPPGGPAGGGIDASNNARAGAAQFAYMPFILEAAQLGSDVSGGAASTTAAAASGANGVSFGYGGCGGGASANGNNSGAGGNGGDGYVRITVWF